VAFNRDYVTVQQGTSIQARRLEVIPPCCACMVNFADGGVGKSGHEQLDLIDAERRASCTRLFFLDRLQNTPG
jgi:hypothetical protein